MVLERCNLARLMAAGMVNTMVLVLWTYLEKIVTQGAYYFGIEPFDSV